MAGVVKPLCLGRPSMEVQQGTTATAEGLDQPSVTAWGSQPGSGSPKVPTR